MSEPKIDFPAPSPSFGTVVGVVQERAGHVLPDGSFIADVNVFCFIDVLVENRTGFKKLVRLPVSREVGDFIMSGEQPAVSYSTVHLERDLIERKNPVDLGRLEEERGARESMVAPLGTATLPKLEGTVCPACGEPQYQTPSGITCVNGHGY